MAGTEAESGATSLSTLVLAGRVLLIAGQAVVTLVVRWVADHETGLELAMWSVCGNVLGSAGVLLLTRGWAKVRPWMQSRRQGRARMERAMQEAR